MATNIVDRQANPTAARPHLEGGIADTTTTLGMPRQLTRPPPPVQPPEETPPRPFTTFPTQQMPAFQRNWLAIQPVPMVYVPHPVSCCGRYFQWTQRRKGRPPHDLHCHVRNTGTLAQYGAYSFVDQRLNFTM